MAYLDDHPNKNQSQMHCPRRQQPSGVVVVHTAENTPDFVAFDGGAEAVARFISTRTDPGSYHDLCDSDSWIPMVRYECEAFHDRTDGGNRHEYGLSAATRADVWPLAPQDWRDGCVRNMARAAARYASWLYIQRGITIPARRISRYQSELRQPGFISHAERDPTRRTDPGAQYPWNQFLALYAQFLVPQEDDDMFSDDDRALLEKINGMLDQRYYTRTEVNSAIDDIARRVGVGTEATMKGVDDKLDEVLTRLAALEAK